MTGLLQKDGLAGMLDAVSPHSIQPQNTLRLKLSRRSRIPLMRPLAKRYRVQVSEPQCVVDLLRTRRPDPPGKVLTEGRALMIRFWILRY